MPRILTPSASSIQALACAYLCPVAFLPSAASAIMSAGNREPLRKDCPRTNGSKSGRGLSSRNFLCPPGLKIVPAPPEGRGWKRTRRQTSLLVCLGQSFPTSCPASSRHPTWRTLLRPRPDPSGDPLHQPTVCSECYVLQAIRDVAPWMPLVRQGLGYPGLGLAEAISSP